MPRNLTKILSETKDFRSKPSLGDRFKLAYDLAVSVLEFHKVGWMHKSISGLNVVFFGAEKVRARDWLREPYVIGFNHSRPDDPQAFTEGLTRRSSSVFYQNPVTRCVGQDIVQALITTALG